MKVTAIIPAYNSAAYIADALESIVWQTVVPAEIIVVDDGSTDCTAEIAESIAGVTVIRKPNAGVSSARNTGARAARGDLLAFLDADDVWLPDKLALQVAAFESTNGTEMCWGYHVNFKEPGSVQPSWMPQEWMHEEMKFMLPSTLVVTPSCFERGIYFDETMTHGEDTDWLLRVRSAGVQEAVVHDVLVLRRIHSTNVSHNLQKGLAGTMTALRRAVSARRAQAGQ